LVALPKVSVMTDKWRPIAGHLSVPLRHADGRDWTAAELRTLDGAGSPELRNIGRGLAAASETTPAARPSAT